MPMSEGPTVVRAALHGLCPRCGAKTLFIGPIRFAVRCRACGQDFRRFNVGDGPAAFLTLAIGALIVVLAVGLELSFNPPVWLHVALWLPLTLVATLFSLRIAKAAMLALEYRHQAREGRLGTDEDADGAE